MPDKSDAQFFYSMSRKLPNYLRTYRKRACLTQDEMAYLLGCSSGAKVSRYEHFRRLPSLLTAFVYETVFGVPARQLFAGIFEQAEVKTLKRVQLLVEKLNRSGADQKKKTARKLGILQGVIGAACPANKP